MLDLVPGGSTLQEVVALAKEIEAAGATIINTGIGWHEARIPTIATSVPRGAYTWVTKRLMGSVSVPLVTSNRINTPEVAEELLADGRADMVVAGPALPRRPGLRRQGGGRAGPMRSTPASAATRPASTTPSAGRSRPAWSIRGPATRPSWSSRRPGCASALAVVGAGPAGLACAVSAAERGHDVTLFDAADEIGGQLNIAKRVPGKEEFDETLRYFRHQLARRGVDVRLNTARHGRGPRRATTRSWSPPASPRASRRSRASTTRASSATSMCCATARRSATRVAIIGAGRHRLRRRGVPDRRRRGGEPGPGDLLPRLGRRHGVRRARRAAGARAPQGPAPGASAPAQDRRRSAPGWARPPAGSTARSSGTGA